MPGSAAERVEAVETAEASAPAAAAAPVAAFASIARSSLAERLGSADTATRARVVQALQRSHGNASVQRLAAQMSPRRQVARTVTFDDCSTTQKERLMEAHRRAHAMIANARKKLADYDGTDPPEVKAALEKHFHSTSKATARAVRFYMWALVVSMSMSLDPQYECQSKQDDGYLAWVPWCVPFADIEIYPLFFKRRSGAERSLDDQASTLAHEWFHKYSCKLDVHYSDEEEYQHDPTIYQLFNADSFGEFIEDVA